MPWLSFFVEGHPRPAGSKRAFWRGDKTVIVDMSGAKGKAWRRAVAEHAEIACRATCDRRRMLAGPIELEVSFYLPRPKRHFDRHGVVREDMRYAHHVIRPDTTKLLRSLEDALTGVVWKDDAQITQQRASKSYGTPAGASVRIRW